MERRILTQITKLEGNGLLLYGFKLIGSRDPIDEDEFGFIVGGEPGDTLATPLTPTPTNPVQLADGVWEVDVSDSVLWLPYGTSAPVGYEPWMMNMSVVGTTKSGDRWGRWGECYTCLEEFPLTEMTKIKGHWYCSKNGCKEDFE